MVITCTVKMSGEKTLHDRSTTAKKAHKKTSPRNLNSQLNVTSFNYNVNDSRKWSERYEKRTVIVEKLGGNWEEKQQFFFFYMERTRKRTVDDRKWISSVSENLRYIRISNHRRTSINMMKTYLPDIGGILYVPLFVNIV